MKVNAEKLTARTAPGVLHELLDRIVQERGRSSEINLRRSMSFGNERYVGQSGNTRWLTPRLLWDAKKAEEYFDPESHWIVYDRPPPESIWKLREVEPELP